jgi:hypothetical protein
MMSFRDDAPSGWGWAADQGDSTGELIERLSTEFAPLVNTDAVIAIVQQCLRDLDATPPNSPRPSRT